MVTVTHGKTNLTEPKLYIMTEHPPVYTMKNGMVRKAWAGQIEPLKKFFPLLSTTLSTRQRST